MDIPDKAGVVIIGGGIMGCSTAYGLANLGCTDVVLLEMSKLTAGSTWHAAGLVGQLRNQAGITQLLGHSVSLYATLEAETGLATGWKMTGGLRLACTEDRMTELKRQTTTARSFGLEMHLLTPSEALELWPVMDASDVVGAAFLPSDGQANPADITQALAKGARNHGVRIIEDCRVTDVRIEEGRVSGVVTDQGAIECEVVVNCCGQWARSLARHSGVNVPLVPLQHQYLITEPIEDLPPNLPTLRDPDRLTYYKEEVGGLVMGGYEPNPIPWANAGIPEGFGHTLLDSDWDHFEPMMANALPRVPALQHAGIKQLLNGPESFTPDGKLYPRRGSRGCRLLCRCGFQCIRHRFRGRRRQSASAMDSRWSSTLRLVGGGYTTLRPAPRRYRLGAYPYPRDVRETLYRGLAPRGA